ncbi:MAG: hypothetical protein EHM65_10940 [Acidobacteriales bacterium]|nr:MAG: hypothetical protein EHM65_10940 [Terriglobales bacterium]
MRSEGERLMHKHRLLFFQFLITSCCLCAQSQGIQGIVLDPRGQPIAGARIECAGAATVTDPGGQFKIEEVSGCQALVSAPGFEARKVQLESGANPRIAMAVAGLAERIVVTATRHQATVEEAGVAASILTRADLVQRQFPFVADVLRDIPGLQVATNGRPGSLTSVYTRGAQRTGTLVLLDGVPLNDPGGELNLAGVASGDIDRVEVIRGPESALFGAEAAAGVVAFHAARRSREHDSPRFTFL